MNKINKNGKMFTLTNQFKTPKKQIIMCDIAGLFPLLYYCIEQRGIIKIIYLITLLKLIRFRTHFNTFYPYIKNDQFIFRFLAKFISIQPFIKNSIFYYEIELFFISK